MGRFLHDRRGMPSQMTSMLTAKVWEEWRIVLTSCLNKLELSLPPAVADHTFLQAPEFFWVPLSRCSSCFLYVTRLWAGKNRPSSSFLLGCWIRVSVSMLTVCILLRARQTLVDVFYSFQECLRVPTRKVMSFENGSPVSWRKVKVWMGLVHIWVMIWPRLFIEADMHHQVHIKSMILGRVFPVSSYLSLLSICRLHPLALATVSNLLITWHILSTQTTSIVLNCGPLKSLRWGSRYVLAF